MGKPYLPDKTEFSQQELIQQEKNFLKLLEQLLQKAKQFQCTIRVIGSIAFRIKAPEYSYIEYKNNRYLTDIDFVTHAKDILKVQDMFFSLGWQEDQGVLRLFGDKRRIFYHPTEDIHSDIFIDKLRFCHIIDFRKRLEIDYPTISLIDLLLEKLQIVEINKKDLVDMMILLRKYEISTDSADITSIDGAYLAKICAGNWGWWKTAKQNIQKVMDFCSEYLQKEDAEIVIKRCEKLIHIIDQKKKTIAWKMRSLIGEKMKWYNQVEEVHRD